MKNEFHGRRNRWSGFKGRSLITLALVLSMIIPVSFFSIAAGKVDTSKQCSLTVTANNMDGDFSDLAEANLEIDLYKVADAVPNEGSDGYTFELLEPYGELKIDAEMNADKWRELSQQAAGITLDVSAGTAKEGFEPVTTGVTGTAISVDSGLYLLIARGGEDGYVTTKEGNIVSRASSDSNTYIFLPELVSLPTKDPNEDGEVNTANSGEWQYNMRVFLKPEKDNGSLRIVKNLERYYVNGGSATFVFEVVAQLGEKVVYSNVVSIVFDDAGTKELLIENLPVGATVTVKEVYSGASYTVVGDGVQTTVITADQENPATVQFSNDYDERQTGGHGITNHFEYDTENNEWKWEQVEGRSQG